MIHRRSLPPEPVHVATPARTCGAGPARLHSRGPHRDDGTADEGYSPPQSIMPAKELFAQAESAVPRGAAAAVRAFWQAAGMVLEVALFEVRPGEEEAFAAAYRRACGEVGTTPGCRSVRLTRGVESPSRFVLLVEWDSVDAHLRNFRATDRFVRWRQAVGPYFAAPPTVEHFTDVAADPAEPPG